MDAVDSMADGLRKVFLAGVGAMATVGEKGGQALDDLAERGENVVKQGKDLNRELTQKGAQARLAGMTGEQRANFVALAQRLSAELDAQDAKAAAKASAVEEQRAAEDRAASVTVAVAAETAEISKA